MLKLEARPQPSKLMSLLSPLMALALTALHRRAAVPGARQGPGARPEHVLRRTLLQHAPDQRGGAEGHAADHHRARPGGVLPLQRLEHRCRRPVPAGRAQRRRFRAVAHHQRHRAAEGHRRDAGAGGQRARRHGLGGPHRAAARQVQRQRDPGQPDAGLRGPAAGQLHGLRPVEGPGRASTSRRPRTSTPPPGCPTWSAARGCTSASSSRWCWWA